MYIESAVASAKWEEEEEKRTENVKRRNNRSLWYDNIKNFHILRTYWICKLGGVKAEAGSGHVLMLIIKLHKINWDKRTKERRNEESKKKKSNQLNN